MDGLERDGDIMTEEWKVIADFPDYAVSSMGRLKRLTNSRCGHVAGMLLSLKPAKVGYSMVDLRGGDKKRKMYVHQLVLEAFVCSRPKGMVCNHIDCNRTNNCVENLEWTTQSKNVQHVYKSGRIPHSLRGEENGFSRFKEGEVWLMKRLLASKKLTQKSIGRIFQTSQAQISLIAKGQRWRHVSYP